MPYTTDIMGRSNSLRQSMTLKNLFDITCSQGERPASHWLEGEQDRLYTYGDLRQKSLDYAAYLAQQLGESNKGRFVAIQQETCKEWFPLFWGLIMAGYNALLLDANLSDEMTGHMLKEAGAVGVITHRKHLIDKGYVQVLSEDLFKAPAAPAGFEPTFADSVALCTSGTTATSRIFVYHEKAVCEQVLNSELLHKLNTRIVDNTPRRALAFLPFHHIFGFMVNLLWVHFIGYESVYLANRSPETILHTCRHFKVEFLVAVPLLANSLSVGLQKKVAKQPAGKRAMFKFAKSLSLALQSAFPAWGMDFARNKLFKDVVGQLLGPDIRCVILGGSHTPREHMRTIAALGYYTIAGFGMTETAITSVETSMHLNTRTSGSVGRPLSTVEYRVQSDGQRNNIGEMYIRGTSIHTGRLENGALIGPGTDQDGWFPTGDIVRLEKGMRMYVEGRSKDVIINESGENVYPDELEDSFSDLENVDQFCVLGIRTQQGERALPTRRRNKTQYEDITLVLSVGDRYRDDKFLLDLMRKVAAINAKLPVLKKVTRVLATPDKFETANGIKVKRIALKNMVENRRIAYRDLDLKSGIAPMTETAPLVNEETVPEDLSKEEIRAKVRRVYAETLDIPVNTVGDTAHFINDLGGDSLQVMSLSLKVEELFSVLIPVEEYGLCTTVNDLTNLLSQRMSGRPAEVEEKKDVTPITDFTQTPEFQEFALREQALLGSGQPNPYFVCHESALFDTSMMDGHEVLNFGSYNYAGMSGRQETKEAAKKAIDKYGTSASGSRLLAGEKSLYQELEREIADWKHAESALVLVGGHSTNVTFVGNFCGKNDLIVYDALAHNSIAQGCQLSRAQSRPFPHNDIVALETILKTQRHKFEKVLIIIEGAYSMDGDIADVPKFVEIKKKYGCFLMVDEAHSACVIGETGGGVDEYFKLSPNDVDIRMGTLSKGLGTCGGYLAGSRAIIEYMRYNLPGFVFSVGISPPLAAACLEAIRLLRSDKSIMKRLHENIQFFTSEAQKRGFNTCLAGETAIIPILVGSDEDAFLLSNMLREKGVFVPPAVFPAVPRGKARLRFCVISEHKPEQITLALDKLAEAAQEAGIELPKY